MAPPVPPGAAATSAAPERYADKDDPSYAAGEGAAWVIGWYEHTVPSESYVNLIPTVAGGTHESGLRAGVFDAVKSFIEHHALLPRGVKLQQDNRLEALKGDRASQHSIRINGQWRVCFVWTDNGPAEVEIVDYH